MRWRTESALGERCWECTAGNDGRSGRSRPARHDGVTGGRMARAAREKGKPVCAQRKSLVTGESRNPSGDPSTSKARPPERSPGARERLLRERCESLRGAFSKHQESTEGEKSSYHKPTFSLPEEA